MKNSQLSIRLFFAFPINAKEGRVWPRPHSMQFVYFMCINFCFIGKSSKMFFTFLAKEVINKPETDADWTIERGEILLLIVPPIDVVVVALVIVSQFC